MLKEFFYSKTPHLTPHHYPDITPIIAPLKPPTIVINLFWNTFSLFVKKPIRI